jgi:hypothetical protein
MSIVLLLKSQTRSPVAPYLIAISSYNLRGILIGLGAVIAEMASWDRSA